MKKISLILAFLALGFNANAVCDTLYIHEANTNKIKASYDVVVANTNQQRAQGLMFVKSMPQDKAMLFIWPEKRQRAMWMKNTYIALDMLFIDDNKIIGFVENAQPHTLTSRTVAKLANKVLEINAKQIQQNNINVNDTISCK